MTDTPSWQAELVEKYFNKTLFLLSPSSREVQVLFTNEADFLAAIQAAYDLGAEAFLTELEKLADRVSSMTGEERAKILPVMDAKLKSALRAAEAKGWRGAALTARNYAAARANMRDNEAAALFDGCADVFLTTALSLEKETPNE